MMKKRTWKNNGTSSCPLICQICGDTARGINFAALTCMSCKMFFRRHVESQKPQMPCYFNDRCVMTPKTRKYCSACRLRSCFRVGMDPKLIRRSPPTSTSKLPTTSLLDDDRSLLTLDEWNLLSNIVNTYDAHNFFVKSKIFFQNQTSLPLKFRCKESNILCHVGTLFAQSSTFIERCPLFHDLSANIRHMLMKRNLSIVGSQNGLFICREMNIFENELYLKCVEQIYGTAYSKQVVQLSRRFDENATLMKIIFLVMIFSSNCSIVVEDSVEYFPSRAILQIENRIVTMLWKYLIYQYRFEEAVIRYASLVKSILDMIQRMGMGTSTQRHWQMVDKIIGQKSCLITLEDEFK
ncbi:unnamed protein product [Adineta ricciae]|uniref:Nuclear receptor domain-containing protein n=1 Tax=Adineta ricciae TaxID=249248 RepID=A0A814J208_ADIRI|nr:unnamed protein product [Adineta ricciae]CAF1374186.1 unnamed protein product [Adineta ricciae]